MHAYVSNMNQWINSKKDWKLKKLIIVKTLVLYLILVVI